MSRKLLQLVIIASLFGFCHKAEMVTPKVDQTTSTEFKDDHIFVSSVNLLKATDGTANFSFATRYEKEISVIEVYKGTSKTNLCSMYKIPLSESSHSLKVYTIPDANDGKEVNYYMIKYKTVKGDFTYSPLYYLKLK